MIGEPRRDHSKPRRQLTGRRAAASTRPRGRAALGVRKPRINWSAAAAPSTAPAPEHRPLGYLPSLDGIRGLAVFAVFAFHAGFGWANGGFLGVSVFFTLSGYLITRLLLDDALATRTIHLLRFWARRFRRLMPAALVTVALVLVLAATALNLQPDQVRGDALATLGYVANWRFLFTGQSYQALFSAPSPLLHFWSLAIEEQFYLVYPLIAAGVVALAGRDRARSALRYVLLGGLALSVLAIVLAVRAGDGDFVYYSTPTRAAELLAGALLACSLAGGRLPGASRRRWALPLGLVSLVGIAVLCTATTSDSGWVTHGGLAVFSLLSVGLIAAALPQGPFSSGLAVAPLRVLGKISYGVYLYHWPVILWLDRDRVGLRGAPLAGVQAAVTLAIAAASYLLIERPIRRGTFPRGVTARFAAPVAIAAVCAVTLFATSVMPKASGIDLAATASKLDALTKPGGSGSASNFTTQNEGTSATTNGHSFNVSLANFTPSSVPAAPAWNTAAPPARIAIFGDSTAMVDGYGLGRWALQTGAFRLVGQDVGMGCAIARGGFIKYIDRPPDNPFPHCGDWAVDWPRVIAQSQPDAAVIIDGPFDVANRMLPGDTQWRSIGDPVFDRYLKSEMLAATDIFVSRGIPVVWVTTPRQLAGRTLPNPGPYPENDPARVIRFNKMVNEVAAERQGVHVVDLRSWLRSQPGGELNWGERPDGVHFTDDAALQVSGWLGPAILSVVRPVA